MLDPNSQLRTDEDSTAIVYDADLLVRQLRDVPNVELPYDDATPHDTINVDEVRPRAEAQWNATLLRQALVGILLRPWSGFEDTYGTRCGFDPDILILPACRASLEVEAKADFLTPPGYGWTPETARIERLIEEYGQSIYANH